MRCPAHVTGKGTHNLPTILIMASCPATSRHTHTHPERRHTHPHPSTPASPNPCDPHPFPPTHPNTQQGQYDEAASFQTLNGRMGEVEVACGKPRSNRMFFLSIPPNVFIAAAGGAADFCSTK